MAGKGLKEPMGNRREPKGNWQEPKVIGNIASKKALREPMGDWEEPK